MQRDIGFWLVAALLCTGVGAVRAQTAPTAADEAEAKRLLNHGKALLNQGDVSAARADFQRAHELVPDRANPYRLLGLTEAQLGDCENAVRHLDEFLHRAPADDVRAVEAKEKRDECQAVLALPQGVLEVETVPPGAEVWLDGATGPSLGKTPLKQSGVLAGAHVVHLRLDGHSPTLRPVTVPDKKTAKLSVKLTRLGRAEAKAEAEKAKAEAAKAEAAKAEAAKAEAAKVEAAKAAAATKPAAPTTAGPTASATPPSPPTAIEKPPVLAHASPSGIRPPVRVQKLDEDEEELDLTQRPRLPTHLVLAPPVATPEPEAPAMSMHRKKVLQGVGIALLGVGAGVGIAGAVGLATDPTRGIDFMLDLGGGGIGRSNAISALSIVGVAVGALSLGAGALLIGLSNRRPTEKATRVEILRVTPAAGRSGGGMVVEGRF